MDAWRVRESVDFLSLASGRRDGEVRKFMQFVQSLKKANADLKAFEPRRHPTGRDRNVCQQE